MFDLINFIVGTICPMDQITQSVLLAEISSSVEALPGLYTDVAVARLKFDALVSQVVGAGPCASCPSFAPTAFA